VKNALSRLLDVGLEELSTTLCKMGEISEESVAISVEGFLKGTNVMEKVRPLSEDLVRLSVDIEDKAFELIAKYQPVASDLRTVKSYIKIAYDLERYGRYALDIAFAHEKLARTEKCASSEKTVEEMIKKVIEMVRISTKALKNLDAELAKTLAKTENEVDELYSKYLDHLATVPPATKCMICNVLVTRYLERIADHTAYVGESIIYIVTGEKIFLR
jgi:phosphate transport system protein